MDTSLVSAVPLSPDVFAENFLRAHENLASWQREQSFESSRAPSH